MNKLDTLAKRLSWARAQMGLSQQDLARAADVSQGTIGNLEAGIRNTARKITSIAAALGVDPGWLADGTGHPIPGTGHIVPAPIAVDSADLEFAVKLLALVAQSTPAGRQQIMDSALSAKKISSISDKTASNDQSK